MLPPTPLARRLSSQSVLFAVGEGVFLTGSAVFFTQIVGLSRRPGRPRPDDRRASSSFFFAVPLGRLADRVGPKRMWALGALAQALLYLAWPWIDGFVAFVAMMVVLAAGRHRRRRRPRRLHARRLHRARSGCGRWPSCARRSTSASRSAR